MLGQALSRNSGQSPRSLVVKVSRRGTAYSLNPQPQSQDSARNGVHHGLRRSRVIPRILRIPKSYNRSPRCDGRVSVASAGKHGDIQRRGIGPDGHGGSVSSEWSHLTERHSTGAQGHRHPARLRGRLLIFLLVMRCALQSTRTGILSMIVATASIQALAKDTPSMAVRNSTVG